MRDDTTALLIYWRMWWHGSQPRLPRPHLFVDFLRSDSVNCHILGCGDPGVGPMILKFELGWHFCIMHLTAKFHHPMFNHSEVIVLTNKVIELRNKQTNWQTNRCRWKHPPRSAMLCRWVITNCSSLTIHSAFSTRKNCLITSGYNENIICFPFNRFTNDQSLVKCRFNGKSADQNLLLSWISRSYSEMLMGPSAVYDSGS